MVMKIDIFNYAATEWHSENDTQCVSSFNINIFIKAQLLDNTFLAGFFVIPGNL